ncbi:hypothetical protein FHG87_008248 [Trinorchestia longiramus]|nr:hypothetical protein FHG87_008248 [Trinorchestia longiramus]
MEVLRILMLILTAERCSAYSLWCYSCSIKDQCFALDTSDASTWTECDPGTTHCVMERTVSAVTGAVVENRMCGGQVYVDKNLPLADGCYVIARQEDSRINTTRCYCSTDYCNLSSSLNGSHALVVLNLLFFAITMKFFVT